MKTGLRSVGCTNDGMVWTLLDANMNGQKVKIRFDLPIGEIEDYVRMLREAADKAKSNIITPEVGLIQ